MLINNQILWYAVSTYSAFFDVNSNVGISETAILSGCSGERSKKGECSCFHNHFGGKIWVARVWLFLCLVINCVEIFKGIWLFRDGNDLFVPTYYDYVPLWLPYHSYCSILLRSCMSHWIITSNVSYDLLEIIILLLWPLCHCTPTFSGDNLPPACQAVELAVVTCDIRYKVPNCVNWLDLLRGKDSYFVVSYWLFVPWLYLRWQRARFQLRFLRY